MGFPPIHPSVKSISHFLKVAEEHDQRNVVVSYWCRMYAIQYALKILPGQKPKEVSDLLVALMEWLEKTKYENRDTDGISNETCGQAIIEEYAIKLFNFAEGQDRNSKFDKNMVKAFYTCSILFDTLDQFGSISEDVEEKRKYAKWRAAYVHNCLKRGQIPTPGSTTILFTDEDEESFKDFLPKHEHDIAMGRIPKPDVENNPVPPVTPASPSTPSQSNTNDIWPEMPPAGPIPQPRNPEIPSQPSITLLPDIAPSADASAASLSPEQMEKAQKYCKFAASCLTYDDVTNAIDNLQKALHLLQFGSEM